MTAIELLHSPELTGLRGLLHLAKDPLLAFEQARKLHGTFVAYEQGGRSMRLVMEPSLVDELLVRHADKLEKDLFTQALRPLLGNGLLTNDGPPWKGQRRLLAPSFHPRQIGKFAEMMVSTTEKYVSGLGAEQSRDVHADMMQLTLEIVLATLFGSDAERTRDVGRLLDVAMDDYRRLTMSFRVAFPAWFPFYSRLRFARTGRKLRSVVEDVVRQRRDLPSGDDMLSRLLEAKDEEGRGMDDRQLVDECLTVLLAGHETTALALTFALDEMTRHPELVAALQAELAEVLGTRSATLEDVPRLRVTRAVAKEILRLYPPAWAAGRIAIQDFELGGSKVEKGTSLVVVPWVVHRDARHFVEPLSFRPERFWNGETEALPKGAYCPFGAGARVCIGNHFAELELILVLATLFQRCSFRRVGNAPLAFSPSVTLRPRGPVRLEMRAPRGTQRSV